uniref:OSJNBa0088I22.14 protein n=4 Tax=Oryza TaxID=4527 RepID=Q7XU40_ORYSJ|nr:OSJNBa0088I22.14 [Oryza sativa Japonica Group]
MACKGAHRLHLFSAVGLQACCSISTKHQSLMQETPVALEAVVDAVEQFQFVQLLVIMHPRDRLESILCILLLVSLFMTLCDAPIALGGEHFNFNKDQKEVWDDLGDLLASFSNLNLCCFNHY